MRSTSVDSLWWVGRFRSTLTSLFLTHLEWPPLEDVTVKARCANDTKLFYGSAVELGHEKKRERSIADLA